MPDLPNTDSKEVMEMAVAAWIVEKVWEQVARAAYADDAEQILTAVYTRVYEALRSANKS